MAATHDVRLYRVPHHHAHLAALAVDHQVEAHTSIVCITADGYGYGTDSSGWGGEVLVGTMRQSQRRGGLMSQRYSGGNLSARFASRALYGILGDQMSGQDFLREVGETCIAEGILLTAESLDVISSSTRRKIGTLESSSAGRFLDAAAALLGICSENSYDAECPMKLEAAARETDLIIEPSFLGSSYGAVLDTTDSLMKLRELKHSGHNTADLAYAIQYHLGFSLADIACDVAESEGIDVVGFSGGVALNRILTQAIRKTVQNRGMTCLIHRSVPPGDGGVSVGQVATAAAQEVL
jgi:hydrogenase maturation protein HypF